MARDGVFDDCDIALTWHPANFTWYALEAARAAFEHVSVFMAYLLCTAELHHILEECTRCSRADGCGCKLLCVSIWRTVTAFTVRPENFPPVLVIA